MHLLCRHLSTPKTPSAKQKRAPPSVVQPGEQIELTFVSLRLKIKFLPNRCSDIERTLQSFPKGCASALSREPVGRVEEQGLGLDTSVNVMTLRVGSFCFFYVCIKQYAVQPVTVRYHGSGQSCVAEHKKIYYLLRFCGTKHRTVQYMVSTVYHAGNKCPLENPALPRLDHLIKYMEI